MTPAVRTPIQDKHCLSRKGLPSRPQLLLYIDQIPPEFGPKLNGEPMGAPDVTPRDVHVPGATCTSELPARTLRGGLETGRLKAVEACLWPCPTRWASPSIRCR
jgi:hypothetical protein